MERALEIFAVIHLTVMGLSHIFQHRAWAEFFMWLATKGRAGVFVLTVVITYGLTQRA